MAFLSLGAYSMLLYWATWPVVGVWFPPMDDWSGDWVWGAITGVAMVWPVGFLAAGYLNQILLARNVSAARRRTAYAVVLWGCAALLWFMVLADQFG
ncbi:hypothetical protein [Diaphorobacter caeni]|uniref:hypothetical protein n=1 Tax=Diaphorobacter caeni TaxID=2784387 RepID=UPI00188F4102|nr:hypothetical protein [Diaphorobacter caeni]MBF5004290.1 hypothetical protein [Diaphorobacter caeni]